MEFIENSFISENELDLETANKLVDEIAVISKSCDSLTNAYDSIKHQMPERRIKIIKNMSFFMRE
jgi:hypothetical protein